MFEKALWMRRHIRQHEPSKNFRVEECRPRHTLTREYRRLNLTTFRITSAPGAAAGSFASLRPYNLRETSQRLADKSTMSVPLPASQQVTRRIPRIKNDVFAQVAANAQQALHTWEERPCDVVSLVADPKEWFGHRCEHRMSIENFSTTRWRQGDEFVLDFQSHRAGKLSFFLNAHGDNIDSPARLSLTFGETPADVAQDLDDCKTWISSSWLPTDVVTVEWLPTSFTTTRRYAFRFVRVKVIALSQKFDISFADIVVRAESGVAPAVFRNVAPLDSGDYLLDQIDYISRVTLRDCMQDVFEDGPRRDQRLWLGDLRIQALVNYATFKNYDLVKRCLYMFAAYAGPDGSIPACIFHRPTMQAGSDFIVDYSALFGPVVLDYAQASGDIDTARQLWPTVLGSIKAALSHLDPNTFSFSCSTSDHWKFLDWDEPLHRDAGMHGLLLYCCRQINSLACLLRETEPLTETVYHMSSAMALESFRRPHTSEAGAFVSGPEQQVSWLSQAWLALGRATSAEESRVALRAAMADENARRPLCPYGWSTMAEALMSVGLYDEAVELLKRYWGGMIQRGADTFWECYDEADAHASPYGDRRNNSYCHAWSVGPSYLLRTVMAGKRQE